MGINTYFAFFLVDRQGGDWRPALGLGFIVSLIQMVIIFFAIRRTVILALPEYFRIGLAGNC
jgi:xanthine/uracil/vitamin C permease (AzgA family)